MPARMLSNMHIFFLFFLQVFRLKPGSESARALQDERKIRFNREQTSMTILDAVFSDVKPEFFQGTLVALHVFLRSGDLEFHGFPKGKLFSYRFQLYFTPLPDCIVVLVLFLMSSPAIRTH